MPANLTLTWCSLSALAGLCLSGCTRSTCVSTCQTEGFTYTVFIGEVCARDLEQAAEYSAEIGPCEPGDELVQTECDPSEDRCLIPGVLFPPD